MVRAIVGGNWGDEGKGKMTDLLGGESDIVIRFQGGANAGHTIINEYGKFVLHILPSGAFHQNITNVIGPGVALNLDSLFKELDMLAEKGVPTPNLKISERAQIVMPYHVLFDKLEEERLGKESFGSTKSGIAPFYSDKYLKVGFQVCDIFDDQLLQKIEKTCRTKNVQLSAVYNKSDLLDPSGLYHYLMTYKPRLEPFVCDTTYYLHDAVKQNKSILLEGQLGALKDPDNGIYPFVTSSSPLAGYGTVGAVVPPHAITDVITVVKAYSSAVGAGAFVSEIFGEEANELRNRGGDGGEYGATTGRPRRMGWLDLVASRYGCRVQGATSVAFTVVDALGYLKEIPVCVAYELDGKRIDSFPPTAKLRHCKPILKTMPGWQCDIRGITRYEDLPENARRYIEFAEEQIGVPVRIISNGPKREDIIYR